MRNNRRPSVRILDTGGTFSQERNAQGRYEPSTRDWRELVPELEEIADISYDSLRRIDSTEMTTADRQEIAQIIARELPEYDGFVVVQGTDTMAQSASALSYMLQRPNKPVVLTGSQIPIFEAHTDAIRNIRGATRAACSELAEVAVSFGEVLLRGSRVQKVDEEGTRAFDTPRIPALARQTIDNQLYLERHATRRKPQLGSAAKLFTAFDENVAMYWQTSGTTDKGLEYIAQDEDLNGLVFAAFGAGNIQSRHEQALTYMMQERNVPVVVATQCPRGIADFDMYDVSSGVVRAGAISAKDLTPQAATQKLMYALGRADKEQIHPKQRRDYVADIMHTEIAGDLRCKPRAAEYALLTTIERAHTG